MTGAGAPNVRYGCIDVGSNTTRLLVAELGPAGIHGIGNERVFTLIGKSLAGGDRIPPEKIAETAAVVAAQAEQARELGAQRVRAVATAAIRRAANAAELVDAVEAQARLALEVLGGDEEARLAFQGAANTVSGGGTLAVVDVGGGSTELAYGRPRGTIDAVYSIPVGSSLIAERHFSWDPPTEPEIAAAQEEVQAAFDAYEPPSVDRAVAVGGSASSLKLLAGGELTAQQLREALHLLAAEPADGIALRFGLEPERVRLLPAGLLILQELSGRLGLPLRICKGGLREGVILEMIKDLARG